MVACCYGADRLIGSYYWSSNSTNPGTIFGGTWEQIKDKFVLAVGDTYTAVDITGGEATQPHLEVLTYYRYFVNTIFK